MAESKTRFYITRQDNGDSYELSSTTEVSISRPLIATSRRVESGKSLTDNSYLENATVSFSGLITNIRNASNVEDTDQFIKEIGDLRAEVPVVLVDVYAENQIVLNCQITTFDIRKTVVEGKGAWNVNLVFKETTFTERASLVVLPEPLPAQKPDVDPQRQQSNNTVQQGDFEVTRTSTAAAINFLISDTNGAPEISTNIPKQGGE